MTGLALERIAAALETIADFYAFQRGQAAERLEREYELRRQVEEVLRALNRIAPPDE